ncbi:hypothetical protein BH09PSE1_BH09PSE1_21440 [soil metagenome]
MIAILFATTVALAQTAAPSVRPTPLISYEEAVRCAGLTQAASEMEGGESADGKTLYDAALYWSLAAGQAAQASGKAAEVADADQNHARILAVQQLNAASADARGDLQRCRARTPDLG